MRLTGWVDVDAPARRLCRDPAPTDTAIDDTGEPNECSVVDCDPDEGDVGSIVGTPIITQFIGTCDPGDPVRYEITTDGAAAQLEIRIAHLSGDGDTCPARESHILQPTPADPLVWDVVLDKIDTYEGCPGTTAEVCGPSTPGIARVMLLWLSDGRLADCAVYGDRVEYWLQERGMSACYDWSQ